MEKAAHESLAERAAIVGYRSFVWIEDDGRLAIWSSEANRFAQEHRDLLRDLRRLPGDNRAFVYEPNGTLRAAQSTIEGAKRYMDPGRIMVVR
jgi:hypothetical protein